jgi:hypothetical protein
MIQFIRMSIAAATITGFFLQSISTEKWMTLNYLFQFWVFLEWVSFKYRDPESEADIVLTDILPILAQLAVMFKVFCP